MNDTHTELSSLNSPHINAKLTIARKRPTLLWSLINNWALACVVCVILQVTTGIRLTLAETIPPGSGVLMLHDGNTEQQAIQLDAHIDMSVQGLLAEFTLTQTFRNTTDNWLEGSYLFPLPEASAIRALILQTGGRTIHGEVQARNEAKRMYTAAKNAGQIAGLIEQQRPNLFTMNVASIAPGDLIHVRLDVMLPVSIADDRLHLTLPTTLTPRYTNLDVIDAPKLHSPFAEASQIRGPRLSLNARIAPLADYSKISSTTHTLLIESDVVSVSNVPMDRDLTLSWPTAQATDTTSHAFVSTHKGQRYVQLLVNPPEISHVGEDVTRELILVIDKSGSMAGVSMDAAKQAMHFAIDSLGADDYFNIIAFDDNSYPMFQASQMANATIKAHSRRFIDRLNADGGTEMDSALSYALKGSAQGERLRQVVFLTDGSVGYEETLLRQIKHQLGDSRLFTVGIGPAPNSWFLEKAAEAGRGIALSIQDSHDVAKPITQLLTSLVHPVITDMAVHYPHGHGEIYPNPIPDLYARKPNMLVSRITDSVDELIITGKQRGKRWRQTVILPQAEPVSEESNSAPALAMHWARQKIATLMDEQRYSVDEDLHKQSIIKLAMDVGLLSRYTSFVAVEAEPVRPANSNLSSTKVTSLIPAGNQMMSIAMPQGAAGADTLSVLSLLLGVTGFAACYLARAKA